MRYAVDEIKSDAFREFVETAIEAKANGDKLPEFEHGSVSVNADVGTEVVKKQKRITSKEIIKEKGFEKKVEDAVLDWVKYKTEKKQAYKETGLRSLLSQIEKKVSQYGAEAVVGIIGESMASNWQGICWSKLEQTPANNQRLRGLRDW